MNRDYIDLLLLSSSYKITFLIGSHRFGSDRNKNHFNYYISNYLSQLELILVNKLN